MTPFDLQSLLRDDRWMRRVARGLLRDPNDVEDAVQEAWVAELEGGGARLRSRRGWLRGVLWNRASGVVRRERLLRERALDGGRERAEALAPSAAEDAAAREAKRVVAEALLDLDEDLRVTVHLTYLADLSTREVAARTGVSPTAVRKRLARAHAELRRRLDAEHDGDRRAWALALTPFLRPDPAPLAAAAAHRTEPRLAKKPIEMLAAAAAVALTAVASFSFLVDGEGPPRSTETRSVETSSAILSLASPELTPAEGTEPARDAAPSQVGASSLAVIRGRLEAPDGEPLVKGTWTLGIRTGTAFEDAGAIGRGGVLEVRVEPIPGASYELRIESEGLATETFDFPRIRNGRTMALGVVRMRRESVLRCRLVDAAGERLVDSPFDAWLRDSTSYVGGWRGQLKLRRTCEPGTGEVVFDGLGPGWYEVRPQLSGVHIDSRVVQVGESEEVAHEFVLPASTEVVAPAHSERGVEVRLTPRRFSLFKGPEGPLEVDAIDAEGRALDVKVTDHLGTRLRVLGAFTPPLSMSISDPRFLPLQLGGIESGEVVRAHLDGTSSIRLDVRGVDGEPIDLYAVRIEASGGARTSGVDVHDGRTPLTGGRVDGLYAGVELRVVIRTDTHRGEAIVADVPAGVVTDVPVWLEPLTSVHGTVRYADGDPAAFVDVALAIPADVGDSTESPLLPMTTHSGSPERFRRAVAACETDSLGRFSVERPVPGDYLLHASTETGLQGWSDRFTVADAPLAIDLEIPRGASVIGSLDLPEWIDPRDLFVRPVWGLSTSTLGVNAFVRVDSNGTFRMDGLPPETVHFFLHVSRDWSFDMKLPPIASATLVAGEPHILECDASASMPGEIRLLPGAAGTFPDDWSLHRTYVPPGRRSSAGFRDIAPSPASEIGPFIAEPGRWTFMASGSNWAALEGASVTVAPGSRSVARVDLATDLAYRSVSIRVEGEPHAAEAVIVSPADSSIRRHGPRFVTDALGMLDVGFPRGEVIISAPAGGKGGRRPESATLTWPPENGAVIELE